AASNSNRASQEALLGSAWDVRVRSQGRVRRVKTTCGSTLLYSPVPLAGGKTAEMPLGSKTNRSPQTAKFRVWLYDSSMVTAGPGSLPWLTVICCSTVI